MNIRFGLKSCVLLLGATLTLSTMAQTPAAPPPGGAGGPPAGGRAGGPPNPAVQAINYRKALYTVIGGQFGPIGGVLQGRGEYKAEDVTKRAERLAVLATMVSEAFPEISKDGDTKAKPEIWSDSAGFANAVKGLVDSTAALATLVKTDKTNSPAFKAAAGKVGEACKNCHDNYRAK